MVTVTTNPEKAEKRNIFFTGNIVAKGTLTILVNKDEDNHFHGTVLENKLPYSDQNTGRVLKFDKANCHQFYGTILIKSL